MTVTNHVVNHQSTCRPYRNRALADIGIAWFQYTRSQHSSCIWIDPTNFGLSTKQHHICHIYSEFSWRISLYCMLPRYPNPIWIWSGDYGKSSKTLSLCANILNCTTQDPTVHRYPLFTLTWPNPYECRISRHWGQGVNYPVGPCWVHGRFWNNSPNFYPVGKGWVSFESTHQSTHWVTLWKNPVGSLRISFKKCPSCAWATHKGFFQKVPINLTTMYPIIYPMGSLRVCGKIEPNWGFSLITLK